MQHNVMAWLSNCPEIGVCVCVFSSLPFFCITYIFVCSLHLLVLFIFIYFFGKSLPLFRFNCVISFFFFFFSVAFQMRHAVCVRFMLTTELCQSFRCTCANQLYAETYWTPWTPIAHPLPASYFDFRWRPLHSPHQVIITRQFYAILIYALFLSVHGVFWYVNTFRHIMRSVCGGNIIMHIQAPRAPASSICLYAVLFNWQKKKKNK